jgi:hypothetical protein
VVVWTIRKQVSMRVVKNHGLTGGTLPDNRVDPPPPLIFEKCDQDQACDNAKFKVNTPSGPVYLCGHHFHVNEQAILDKDYEVNFVNA